jgi:hypothetical protein
MGTHVMRCDAIHRAKGGSLSNPLARISGFRLASDVTAGHTDQTNGLKWPEYNSEVARPNLNLVVSAGKSYLLYIAVPTTT